MLINTQCPLVTQITQQRVISPYATSHPALSMINTQMWLFSMLLNFLWPLYHLENILTGFSTLRENTHARQCDLLQMPWEGPCLRHTECPYHKFILLRAVLSNADGLTGRSSNTSRCPFAALHQGLLLQIKRDALSHFHISERSVSLFFLEKEDKGFFLQLPQNSPVSSMFFNHFSQLPL